MATLRSVALVAVSVLLLAAPAGADALADAKKAVERKDWPGAYESLRSVLRERGDDREAALLVARVATEGNLEEAFHSSEDALLRVLEKNPADREARLALADAYLAHAQRLGSDPSASSSINTVFADAKAQFAEMLAKDPSDEAAGAGMVRVAYFQGDYAGAVAAADAFLAKAPKASKVSFWKGQALYVQATDAWKNEGAQAPRTRELFGKAAGAYEAAATADPKSYDAWMQLAYSRQYMGEVEPARAAYEKALDADAQSKFPMKGIQVLYGADDAKYGQVLAELAKSHPKNAAVAWFLASRHLGRGEWDEALKAFDAYMALSDQPQAAQTWVGEAWRGKGNQDKAREAYRKALEANPDDQVAAAGLEAPLKERAREAGRSARAAMQLVEDYKPLLALAPRNPLVRNNLGFILREAVNANSKGQGEIREVDGDWLKVLRECARVYEEAANVVGEWRPEHATLPWTTQYEYAGTINDAGLMFWYYPQIRDAEKAERYYRRALEFTNSGYGDACTNLIKMYAAQEKWDQAWDIARECVENLLDGAGNADERNQGVVRAMMEQMRSAGHAPEER